MTEDESDDLPEGWARASLPEVFHLNPSKPKATDHPDDTPVTFVPMPAVDAVSGTIATPSVRPFAEVRKGFTAFRNDDVILAKITPCMENGKAAVARGLTNGLGFGSTEFHVFRPTGAVLPDFLFHFIRQESFRREAEAEMTGSVGQKRVPAEHLKGVELPIPPLAEQRRIVTAVEALLAKVSSARERLERVPAKMNRFRQAVFAAACSGRLTTDWRAEKTDSAYATSLLATVGVAPLGENVPNEDLPESWAWVRFGDILSEFKNGLSTKPNQSPPGTPILRINAVRPCEVSFADLRYLDCSADQKADYAIRNGDLLFTRYNGSLDLLGVCGLVRGINGEVLVYPDKLMRGRLRSPLILAEYCEKFFSSPAARERMVAKAKSSAGQNGVSGSDVKSQPLALPPTDEQEEIVRRVSALFALANSFEQRAASALKRVESLTQAVLAMAFRGELVSTEAELARQENRTYETANELLARIRVTPAAVAKPKRARKSTG
jgi:type I restriction enzyme, S subunit